MSTGVDLVRFDLPVAPWQRTVPGAVYENAALDAVSSGG
jgi:hypothetical protein